MMAPIGKLMIMMGLGIVLLGVAFMFASKIPFFGRLPGDIRVERENYSFYFPVATCLLISIILSLIFWLLSRFR